MHVTEQKEKRQLKRRGTDERIILKRVLKILDVSFRWNLLYAVRYSILFTNNVALFQ
jgi:hypothetical protein